MNGYLKAKNAGLPKRRVFVQGTKAGNWFFACGEFVSIFSTIHKIVSENGEQCFRTKDGMRFVVTEEQTGKKENEMEISQHLKKVLAHATTNENYDLISSVSKELAKLVKLPLIELPTKNNEQEIAPLPTFTILPGWNCLDADGDNQGFVFLGREVVEKVCEIYKLLFPLIPSRMGLLRILFGVVENTKHCLVHQYGDNGKIPGLCSENSLQMFSAHYLFTNRNNSDLEKMLDNAKEWCSYMDGDFQKISQVLEKM